MKMAVQLKKMKLAVQLNEHEIERQKKTFAFLVLVSRQFNIHNLTFKLRKNRKDSFSY